MHYTTLLAAAVALAAVAPCLAQDPRPDLQPFASGFSQPLDLTHAGDGSGRLFVNQKGGIIKVLAADGSVIGDFLDITAKVSSPGERGLLGLAFAPDYPTTGRFYVNYSNLAGDNVIARYTRSPTDANRADPASEEILYTIAQPFDNHNGGDLAFGPDGLLYVASGDGGSGNDPQNNAQNLRNPLGAILRLDVSGATGYVAAGNYPGAIPEIFAAGLRNPYRMTFDRATGTLWIGDVGQGAREEIDTLRPDAVAANFGWRCFEGTLPTPGVSRAGCEPFASYEPPIYEYLHPTGLSVTGGVVYRGADFPQLRGYYVFADYRTSLGFALRGRGAAQEVYQYPGFGDGLVGFGEDAAGEVYAVSIFGTISRLVSNAPLPVSVTEFAATPRDCGATVRWATTDELDLSHFELEVAGDDLQWAAFAKTTPGAPDGRYSERVDLSGGGRYARLVSVDLDGTRDIGPVIRLEDACAPRLYAYPNPASASAEVTLSLASETAPVFVSDALGRTVRTLDPRRSPRLTLRTSELAPGTYFVRQAGQVTRVVIGE